MPKESEGLQRAPLGEQIGLAMRLRRLESSFRALKISTEELQDNVSALQKEISQPRKFERYARPILRNLKSEFSELRSGAKALSEGQKALQAELHSYLVAQSMGLDLNLVPLHRFLPIRIRLSRARFPQFYRVLRSVEDFSESLGFSISDDFPLETGSIFKRIFARTKEAATHPEFTERLKQAEHALKLALVKKQEASINKDQAQAASALLRSLDGDPNALIQVGSILIVKITDKKGSRVYVRTLTTNEMIYLEENPHLFDNPQKIFAVLSNYQKDRKALPRSKR